MKLAFDENVPAGMVRVFQSLAAERILRREMGNFEIVSAKSYAPSPADADYKKKSDVPWLTRYADDGGKIIISGDCAMIEKPHELLALKQAGFVVILFERSWSSWDFFKKSSLLLHYWIDLAKKAKRAKPGAMWRIPGHWRDDDGPRAITIKEDKLSKSPPAIAVRKVSSRSKASRVRHRRNEVQKEAEAASAERPAAEQGQLDLMIPKKPGDGAAS